MIVGNAQSITFGDLFLSRYNRSGEKTVIKIIFPLESTTVETLFQS